MDLKRRTKREGGFTLIELISVIVILGILAAVVVPKYNDMTTQAQKGATMAAVSEGISRFNLAYANYTMETGAPPKTLAVLNANSPATGAPYLPTGTIQTGDYVMQIEASTVVVANSGGNGSVKITAWMKDDTAAAASLKAQSKVIPVNWGS
ncbi:MAG: type II secretion system protein [Humidesulfovibrio sp.]|uniref:type II secretion system protein n=1 Tax=Humidesulfovibrio sp. TaxID=2910988 RepID=UPI002735AE0B|nr:type II secretion system protein [Humidesulfovibrio sp.]MDP2848229.1 type II secretion system protein [Humidesulfovibrio sp.]